MLFPTLVSYSETSIKRTPSGPSQAGSEIATEKYEYQYDQKLSVGDQSSKAGRQQAIILLSPWHLKFQGKRAFF